MTQPPIPIGVRLSLPTKEMTPESLVATCRTAIDLGFSSIWTPDHVLVPERTSSPYPYSADGKPTFGANRSFLDPLHTLGWLASQLPTAGLGTGVLIAPLRRPAVLAKQLSTASWFARRPLDIGIGTGWLREEYDAIGAQFEHRATRLEKELAEVRQLITTGRRSYEVRGSQGDAIEMEFFQEPMAPAPVRFLYGGHSPLALRIAARSCDGWYPSKRTVDQLATHSAELAGYCEDVGRDFSSLRRVVKTGTGPDPADGGINRKNVQAYAELGFDAAVLDMPYEFPGTTEATRILERVAERTWG